MMAFKLAFLAILWHPWMGVEAAGCPKLSPVPIDEHFLFAGQPPDGFYSSYSSGDQGVPHYTPRRMNKKAIAGPGTICYNFKMKISGQNEITGPPIECSYKSVSALYCNTGVKGPTAAALTSLGIQTPAAMVQVIVDTDNRTFLAVGYCSDGAFYEWAILTTNLVDKSLRSKTAAALSLTMADIREAATKRFKFSRIGFEKGRCSGSKKLMAGVASVRDGLSGLFGR